MGGGGGGGARVIVGIRTWTFVTLYCDKTIVLLCNIVITSIQAIGIRVGTLVESLTGLVFALVVAFVYSWVLAFVIVGFMPLIALSSVLYFSLAAGTTRLKSQTLKDSTEVNNYTH